VPADTKQVEDTVADALVSFGAEREQVSREATLEALGIDSLDLAELSQIVEERFGVRLTGADVSAVATVGDAVDLVVGRS
jgi:acyl carrier protein